MKLVFVCLQVAFVLVVLGVFFVFEFVNEVVESDDYLVGVDFDVQLFFDLILSGVKIDLVINEKEFLQIILLT